MKKHYCAFKRGLAIVLSAGMVFGGVDLQTLAAEDASFAVEKTFEAEAEPETAAEEIPVISDTESETAVEEISVISDTKVETPAEEISVISDTESAESGTSGESEGTTAAEETGVEEAPDTYDAAEDIAGGVIDEDYGHITWSIDASGKLTVEGTGDFSDSTDCGRAPWWGRSSITSVVVNVSGMKDASS